MPILTSIAASSAKAFGFTGGGAAGPGQEAFTTAGTYSWVAPAGVTSICAVRVGGGGGAARYSGISGGTGNYGAGGGGGALRYINNFAVTPGSSYTVVVGAKGLGNTLAACTAGGQSYFNSTGTVYADGGHKGISGTVWGTAATGGNGPGGGSGGQGSSSTNGGGGYGGGGGAAGYSGNGGNYPSQTQSAIEPTGGGGGGGFASGGGVGILGEGSSGSNGFFGGLGGSGGANGTTYAPNSSSSSTGGNYGGGGGCMNNSPTGVVTGDPGSQNGAVGAVRIIWGAGRAFPSTNTGDV